MLSPAAAPSQPVDLLIRHGYLLTMDAAGTLVEDGAVAVRGSTIVAVGPDAELASRYSAARVLDAAGAPVHPGLVETHLHASFQLFRGVLPDHLAETDAFDTFESVFFNTVTDEEEYLAVALAALEMIRSGTTCFLEAGTVLQPAAAAAAAELVGIRAVLADPFIWDQPQGFAQGQHAPDAACAAAARTRPLLRRAPQSRGEALALLGTELRRNADPDALVTGHVAVLGLGTASLELMLAAQERASAAGTVLNIHQSYSPADTDADRRRFGRDPLVFLTEAGFLRRNVTLGHANHLTDPECDALLATGASIAWAPAASMMWGHGGCFTGRHAELHRRGANIALGSDSANWSNNFDLFRQASLAVLTAREAHQDRTYLVAEDGLHMATRAGARAAGMEHRLGSLEAGKLADIVIHTLNRPELMPPTNLVRNLLYSSRSRSVHTVVVNGRVVLEAGQFPHLDEPALLARIGEASRSLLRRMGHTVEANRVPRPAQRPQ
jgi:5-methylthioadenosine/S-adenosylhomocysteine deaminase